ncbi:hypothetical protein [Kitasatospora purpeofusca]|uniref:hypothetical protein n=1 Tax=Kitasatospora purpeofusca TaxID=67352 RepID=UPI0036558A57
MSDASATQRAAEDQAEQDMAEHLETLAALEQAHGEVHRLRTLLLKSGAAEEAYAEVLVPEPPSSFETLLDRLGELPKILFSGDRRRTLGLDDTDGRKAPMWARKSWQALRALDSYAAISTTEGFNGNFRAFCERQPSGALVISTHNVAMVESESVNNQWLDERLLPVPIEVDPAGKVVMEAHVKIDSKGSTSPRIYFYDDTAGVTGKVIVGLISRHPTNTQS